jgi:hypothetical protein
VKGAVGDRGEGVSVRGSMEQRRYRGGVVVVGVDEVDQVDWVIEETRKGTEKERKKKRKRK